MLRVVCMLLLTSCMLVQGMDSLAESESESDDIELSSQTECSISANDVPPQQTYMQYVVSVYNNRITKKSLSAMVIVVFLAAAVGGGIFFLQYENSTD